MQAGWRSVTPGFFNAMGIPLLQGRVLSETDRTGSDGAVVISRSMARRLWPGESAIGKRLFWGGATGTPRTVVGVVGDIRDVQLDADPAPLMFLPYGQAPVAGMTLVIRTDGDPASVAGAVRRELRAEDRALPVPDVRALSESRSAAVAEPRFRMLLLGGFAAAALLLATVGIYGVMAFAVAQRTREIGVRMALGAHARRVFRLVLRQGMALAGIGVIAGLAGALAVTHLLESLLYGVSTTDPVIFMTVALLLGAVTLIGAYLPARRAARIDPIVTLREE
jgi:predicted permease